MTETKTPSLMHYGVKGMKWGVRKDRGHEGERVKTKKLAKLDRKFEKKASSQSEYFKIYNSFAARMNAGETDKFNDQPKYKNADFTNDSPLRRKYYKEYSEMATKVLNEESSKLLGTNASGNRKLHFDYDVENDFLPRAYIVEMTDQVKHAAIPDGAIEVEITFDATNRIKKLNLPDASHALELGENFLAHYGVKGMRWGIRKDRRSSSIPATKVKVTSLPGRRVTATGGTGQKPSADAVRATVLRQKAKKSTTDALSDKELQTVINRMRLEQQYAQLQPATGFQAGREFAANFILNVGKQQAQQAANAVVQKKINDALIAKGLVDAKKKK